MCKEQEVLPCVAVHYWMSSFSHVLPWGRSSLCTLLLWPNERSTHLWSAFAFKTLTGTAHLFVYGNGKTITEWHSQVYTCACMCIQFNESVALQDAAAWSSYFSCCRSISEISFHLCVQPSIPPSGQQENKTRQRMNESGRGRLA